VRVGIIGGAGGGQHGGPLPFSTHGSLSMLNSLTAQNVIWQGARLICLDERHVGVLPGMHGVCSLAWILEKVA
jgi:hypothetical protein